MVNRLNKLHDEGSNHDTKDSSNNLLASYCYLYDFFNDVICEYIWKKNQEKLLTKGSIQTKQK